jgi:hypothetical protein
MILDSKYCSEFQAHLVGLILKSVGLFVGAYAMKIQSLSLFYVCSILPIGLGQMICFYRLLFNHQLWFKRINQQNLGSGLYGFIIGVWSVFFIFLSIPLLEICEIYDVIYIYATLSSIFGIYPLFAIDETKYMVIPSSSENIDNIEMIDILATQTSNERELTPTKLDENNNINEDLKENEISIIDESSKDIVDNDLPEYKEILSKVHDDDPELELSFLEICECPQTWVLLTFFVVILTPGIIIIFIYLFYNNF